MHNFFRLLRRWFQLPQPASSRELPAMSLRELADLPATHPPCDPCAG